MNSAIMAERQALAIQAIEAQTRRLGGEYVAPTVRASGPVARYVLILEAVAAALAGIGSAVPEAEVAEAAMPVTAPKGRRKGARDGAK